MPVCILLVAAISVVGATLVGYHLLEEKQRRFEALQTKLNVTARRRAPLQ
jgi:hypothetical protein